MAAFIWAWLLGTAHSDPLIMETDQALAIHLPTSGLNQIGAALQNVLPPTVTIAAGSNVLSCSTSTSLDYTLDTIDLTFAIDDVEFVTSDGVLDLLIVGHLGSSATTATIVGDCSVLSDLNETCDVHLGTTPFTLSMDMLMSLNEGDLLVEAGEPLLEVAPVTNPLSNCLLADGVDTILGQDPYIFSNLIEEALEPELTVIPEAIESNLSGVVDSLNIVEQLDLLGTDVSIELFPSVVQVEEAGIVLGFGATLGTETQDRCIDSTTFSVPEDQAWPIFTGEMFQTGMRYDAGVFLGRHFVDQLLYAVWASEALCLNVSELADLTFTGEFAAGFLGDELGELMGSKVVDLQLQVDRPLAVSFSDDQPPISIALSDTYLETRGQILDRDILLQSVEMNADLGLYIEIESQRLTLELPLESEDFFFNEVYHEILPPGYSDGVPNLIDLALGSVLTDDLFPTVLLPSILGMDIDRLIWQPTEDGAWLGGHVILDVDQIQPVAITGCSSDNIGCDGGGPTIDIDLENILGCDSTTVGCEGGCSQSPDGYTLRLPAGRVFGTFLILSVWFRRRRE